MEYRRRSKMFTFDDTPILPQTTNDLTTAPRWYVRYWSYAKKLIGNFWNDPTTEKKYDDYESQPVPRSPRSPRRIQKQLYEM